MIDSLAADAATLGERGGQRAGCKAHARIVKGKTVLKVDGEKRTLPRADLV